MPIPKRWRHGRFPDSVSSSAPLCMLSLQSTLESSSRLSFPGELHPPYSQLREMWTSSPSLTDFSLRQFTLSPDMPPRLDVDYLVQLIGEAQRDPSSFGGWVFEESARVLLETVPNSSYVDNNEFTHAAKYLFLGACFTPPLRTLLDTPVTVPLASSLVNLSVGFCEASSSLGTTPLIIRSIMVANMREWAERRKLSEFAFKPEGLTSPKFLELIRAQTVSEERELPPSESTRVSAPFRLNQEFCEATSPVKFLLWVFEKNVVVPRSEVLPDLRRLLADHLGPLASRYPFLDTVETAPHEGAFERPQRKFAPGYYFDVFGTLINHDGTPNIRLIQRMMDLQRSNVSRPVFLVSDSQSDEVRRVLSFLPEIPPLLSKNALQDKELECLIDNDSPEGQGLYAARHLSPEEVLRLGIHS